MIEDMTVRNFVEKTRHDYIRHVRHSQPFSGRAGSVIEGFFGRRPRCNRIAAIGRHPKPLNNKRPFYRLYLIQGDRQAVRTFMDKMRRTFSV